MADARASNQEHCLSALRAGDRDRYLCALLTPENHRGPVASLYAFNLELARIRELITEPMMGEVRLQWWRDLINSEARGEALANPIAAGLLETIERYQLPKPLLQNMLEARQFDLYDDPMPDRNTFEGYAGETASALIQLCVHVLAPEASDHTSTAAGHAGVAQSIAGALLLLPVHRSRGQVYIPGDILSASGLDRERFLDGNDRVAIDHAIAGFVALGREHLASARAAGSGVPAEAFAAFLPVATAEQVFDYAGRAGAGLLAQPLQVPQWRRQWRFWRAARKGRF
ncbi:MAG: phytoene/squalene synthase family protein [Pseudomonadota bacterium]